MWSFLYLVSRLLDDANAVKRGSVGKRIARRTAGRDGIGGGEG